MAVEHSVTNEAVGNRQDAAHDANERILLVLLIVSPAGHGLLDLIKRRPQQPHTEEEENPGEARDKRRTEQNEDEAQEQRDDDSEEEGLLLILARDPESLEDQDENEEVVDRQRPLHRPARIELLGVQPPVRQPDTDAENAREADVEQRPASCFGSRRRVRITGVPQEIKHNQTGGYESENAPRPRVNNHAYLLTIRPWNFSVGPRPTRVTRAVCSKPRGRPRPSPGW